MKKKQLLWILLTVLVLTALLGACGEGILPPKESAAPAPMPTPSPTPTPAPFTGEIEAVELNQALSYGVDAQNGALYAMENLVARRDTAVFVRLSGSLGHVPDERDYLEVSRDGQVIGTYAPGALSTEDSLCFVLTGEDAAALTEGKYTFRAVVDDAEQTCRAELTETDSLRVLLVPILGNFLGATAYPAEGWQDYLWHLAACWPLANDGLQVMTAPGLDLSGEAYDLTRTGSMWAAWEALREQAGTLEPYDLVIGFVSGMMGEGSTCGCFGKDGVVLINTAQSAPEAVITHFAAQTLGAGDEYEGGLFNLEANPAPYGVTGVDAATGESTISDARSVEPASDYGLFCGGSVVKAEQVPFDLRRSRLLGDAASFMGDAAEYTQNYWISSDLWNFLFATLTQPAAGDAQQLLPENTGYLARVSGLIGQDGSLRLRSLVTAKEGTPWAESAEMGTYRIVFVNADGTALGRFWFDLDFMTPTDAPSVQAWAPFDFVLPVPDGAAGVLVYGPAADEEGNTADRLLGRVDLSAGEPFSFFTNLEENQTCSGITRVEWKTEDEDSTAMYYELYFTAGDTNMLVYRGTQTFAEVDLLALPDAETFVFTILTSDGGRSSVSVSPTLRMEKP